MLDTASLETMLVTRSGEYTVHLASSPNGDLIVLDHQRELIIHDVAASRIVHRQAQCPTAAAFSPDGTVLAMGYRDAAIEIRDSRTPVPRGTPLLGHSRAIRGLAFSPDGRTLVSVSEDGAVKLWDMTTNEELLMLRWPDGASLSQPHFTPDGRTLGFCAQGPDGTRLYLLPTALPGGLDPEEVPRIRD
jgi:WD40 repeat protein